MKLIDQIKNIDFHHRNNEQVEDLEKAYNLILPHLKIENKDFLRQDFDEFVKQGRYIILNTFCGGIIFLREPEIIENIKIEFFSLSNEAISSLEYSAEIRNSRNVKYKSNVGKIESTKWFLQNIFPNFQHYDSSVKNVLITIIGKIVKRICEYYNINSWDMKYVKEFDLELILDNISIEKLKIEIDKIELKTNE